MGAGSRLRWGSREWDLVEPQGAKLSAETRQDETPVVMVIELDFRVTDRVEQYM
jgi:hypothetical protein